MTNWVWQLGFGAGPTSIDVYVAATTLDEALNHLASLKRDRSEVIYVNRKQEINDTRSR